MENKHTQQVDFSNPNADKITSGIANKPVLNKQTAIQQLIDEIVEHFTYDNYLTDDNKITLETIRLRCLSKLSIEKEQILDFARNAIAKTINEDIQNPFNLEQYYNETYGK
jgi:hypothetical protein